jgi:very-long-chain (3R)-3-hydroxyacyl-CoA dehydratase
MADTIRYTYLAANLWNKAPQWLVWSRYSMFFPLYPVGIGAEWWLLYRAIKPSKNISAIIPPVFWFCLMLYVPGKLPHAMVTIKVNIIIGSWKMYTYMIKQRKKTLGGTKKIM